MFYLYSWNSLVVMQYLAIVHNDIIAALLVIMAEYLLLKISLSGQCRFLRQQAWLSELHLANPMRVSMICSVHVSLLLCGSLGRLCRPRIDINHLRPFAFGRKARCEHQLGHSCDRRFIGTRKTAGVTLGDE